MTSMYRNLLFGGVAAASLAIGIGAALAHTLNPTGVLLEWAPTNPVLSGDSATDVALQGTVQGVTPDVNHVYGKMQFYMAVDQFGDPSDLANSVPNIGDWHPLNDPGATINGLGVGSHNHDLDAEGVLPGDKVAFYAKHVTGGGSDKIGTKEGAIVEITMADECTGLDLSPSLVGGSLGAQIGAQGQQWTFGIKVTNCTGADISKAKVQGGTNGWGNFISATANGTSLLPRSNRRNEIITWTGSLADGASVNILVTMQGPPPADAACSPVTDPQDYIAGTELYLSGIWSASGGGYKTEMEEKITLFALCPPV